jgi:glycosyltransferase involved in cell wall biosynthesis
MPDEKAPLSVVIPLYNKERHVARALQSVLNQTYGDLELIVVDDGSTDGSAEVVQTFRDPRIRLVHREHINSWGGHAARNVGIAESRADLIAFLDADDEWLPEHLATIRRLSERCPECGAFATSLCAVTPQGTVERFRYKDIPASPWEGVLPNYFRAALGTWPVNSSSVAVCKRVFEDVGRFPEGERHGGDLDMWCRIALRYPIAFSNYAGAVYHADADSRIGHSIDTENCYARLFKTLDDAVESKVLPPGVSLRNLLDYRNRLIIGLAAIRLRKGGRQSARLILKRITFSASSSGDFLRRCLYSYAPTPLLDLARRMKRSLPPHEGAK